MHFALLVITRTPNIEPALLQFQEYDGPGTCQGMQLEFEDNEDEMRREWENDTCEFYRAPNGELLFTWDRRFHRPFHGSTHVPPGYTKVTAPLREKYPTFDIFVSDYYGSERDETTGRHGRWHNPRGKWDWWVVGGRYSDRLAANGRLCDQCQFKDLDWSTMQDERRVKAAGWWHEAHLEYPDNPSIRNYMFDIKTGETQEQYLSRQSTFSSFAVLTETDSGEYLWVECGWGNKEKPNAEWQTEFNSILAATSPDMWLTMVDCHT